MTGTGTSMLYELAPSVVIIAAPLETREAAGIATALPPLMLILPPLLDKVCVGTSMLNELGARVLITAAPLPTREAVLDGRTIVLPPLILRFAPLMLSVGLLEIVKFG